MAISIKELEELQHKLSKNIQLLNRSITKIKTFSDKPVTYNIAEIREALQIAKEALSLYDQLEKLLKSEYPENEVRHKINYYRDHRKNILSYYKFLVKTLKRFSTYHNDYTTELRSAAKYILDKCQPYLQDIDYDITEYKMCRGMKTNNPVVYRKRRSDRRPKDTEPTLHNMFNQYFSEAFGHPFRNAVFATGDCRESGLYGEIYVIFPVGNYEILWTSEFSDLYSNFDGTEDVFYADTDDDEYAEEPEYDLDKVFEVLDMVSWETDDIKEAIRAETEIMVWCDNYIGIKFEYYQHFIDIFNQLSGKQ